MYYWFTNDRVLGSSLMLHNNILISLGLGGGGGLRLVVLEVLSIT